MSIYAVEQYIRETEKLIRHGGSSNEGTLEQAFANLLNEYCKQKGFVLAPKIALRTPSGKTIIPDGTIKDSLRLDWGYWESKDEKDDLDDEIKAKFKKDYPKDNILFEDQGRRPPRHRLYAAGDRQVYDRVHRLCKSEDSFVYCFKVDGHLSDQ
jgi:hypothetical protein